MEGPEFTNHRPACPRCGYDQSGVMATWTDRCPVEGRCSECGIEFAWSDILDPGRCVLAWYVEHSGRLRGQLARTAPTLMRMLLPWVFWSRVDVHKQIAVRRLLVWNLLVALGAQIGLCVPAGVLVSRIWPHVAWPTVWSHVTVRGVVANGLLWPVANFDGVTVRWNSPFVAYWQVRLSMWIIPLGFSLTWMLVLSILRRTSRGAHLSFRHLGRAVLLQAGVLILLIQLSKVLYLCEVQVRSMELANLGVFLFACLWSAVWWASAVWIGWRIRSVPLVLIGTLAGIAGGSLLLFVENRASGMFSYTL